MLADVLVPSNTRKVQNDEAAVRHCAALLLQGELVVLPTETVYGLAADATSDAACARVFEVKRRPHDNPLIVHCADGEDALRCFDNGHGGQQHKARSYVYAKALLETYAPGPLSVIAYANDRVCSTARAGGQTLCVRVPSHLLFAQVIRAVARPLAAPSANVSGRPSATNARMAHAELGHCVAAVLDGGQCALGLESTIVDCTRTPPVVVRPGAITQGEVAATLVKAMQGFEKTQQVRSPNSAPSAVVPGSAYPHYKPRCTVHAVELQHCATLQASAAQVCNLSMRLCVRRRVQSDLAELGWKLCYCYETWEALAAALYAKFVEAEEVHCAAVFVDMPTEAEHEGLRNRIARASHVRKL